MPLSAVEITERLAVRDTGRADGPPIVFLHGYGTNQALWEHVAPAFEADHRVVRFDHAGSGASAPNAWDPVRHGSLLGYADDLCALVEALDLHDAIVVGHSVGGMIGALAIAASPARFSRLVMVAPSARYLNDDGYVGGFERGDIEGLLQLLDTDYLGWAQTMAPVLIGAAPTQLAEELSTMLSSAPAAGRAMAHSFMLADHRDDLAEVVVPTLVMQTPEDPFVPMSVAHDVERRLPLGHLVQLGTTGHFPVLTAPGEVIAAIRSFLSQP